MILYRIILPNNKDITNEKTKGLNSFKYDDSIEYVHFFILPQNLEIYQLYDFEQLNIKSIVLKCDIPFNLLEFGVGLYRWYYRFKYVPFLEARIKKDDFNDSYIKEKSTYVKHEWKNEEIFKRYLINCIYNQNAFKYLDSKRYLLELNKHFNFLHYFNQEDLLKENIIVNDYPDNESLINLKKKELSFIKRMLFSIKESIENTYLYDANFKDLTYYEKIKTKNHN